MSIRDGSQFPYPELRKRYTRERPEPVLWQWKTLSSELAAAEHTEYGSLTVALPGGDNEIVPGAALTFQIVPPGGRTTPHSHSWWHLYFVRSGTGSVVFDTSVDAAELAGGDLLLIPAWSVHHFENHAENDLLLLSMTNFPQQADLANLLVTTEEGAR